MICTTENFQPFDTFYVETLNDVHISSEFGEEEIDLELEFSDNGVRIFNDLMRKTGNKYGFFLGD